MSEYRIEFDSAGAVLLAIPGVPLCVVGAIFANGAGHWVFAGLAVVFALLVAGVFIEDWWKRRKAGKS
jgi:hypothetical protein